MQGIRALRLKKKLSQNELAKMVGTTQAAVAMWEAGTRMPRSEKLPAIAEALGCNVADLFSKQADGRG